METVDRLITLGVGTKGAEEWFSTFQDLSELAHNLGETHGYVAVSSSAIDEYSDVDEDLFHDENTLLKVVTAINKAAPNLTSDEVTDVVNELQNAGILFRERR